MSDFKFIKIPNLETWVILDPKRAKRLHIPGRRCVFCPGSEKNEPDIYRIGGENHDSSWKVRVIKNKYPFAPIHDVVILAPDHAKYISDLSIDQVKLGIEAYVNRYNAYKKDGTVCIFGNAGHEAGESIGHPHAQIAVVPKEVDVVVPKLEKELDYRGEHLDLGEFRLICPPYSQWPDEVWIIPLERDRIFGEISYREIEGLGFILHRILKIFELRHGHKFPHNFYIYPYKDWYYRIMPRAKIPGGFEIATGIFVNTQDPAETMKFIKEHFAESEDEKIFKNKAKYRRGV